MWLAALVVLTGYPLSEIRAQAVAEPSTLLLSPMDGTADARFAIGGARAIAAGDFVAGRFGQGIDLVDGSVVRYSGSDGNLHPASGTIEFWIRPHWSGDDGEKHSVFNCAFGERGYININVLPGGQLGIAIAAGRGDQWIWRRADADITSWKAEQWHHVACSWGDGRIAVFVDGTIGRRTVSDAQMPHAVPAELTFLASNAVMDDIRISGRRMTAEDVRASIKQSLGPPPYRLLADVVPVPTAECAVGFRVLTGGVRVPLIMDKGSSPSWLGIPAGGLVEIPLDGQFDRWQATLGVDELSGSDVSCSVEIRVDQRVVINTDVSAGKGAGRPLQLDIRGARKMTVRVNRRPSTTVPTMVVLASGAVSRRDARPMMPPAHEVSAARIDMYRRQLMADHCSWEIPGDEPLVAMPKYWEDDVDPETTPDPLEIGRPVTGFAAPGEYEPLNFVLYARRELKQVQIGVSDLTITGTDRTLSKRHIVLRFALRGLMRDLYPLPVERSTVVSRFLLPVEPLDMQPQSLREYQLTIQVPERTTPGTYIGNINVSSSSGPTITIPVRFEVLPIRLLPLKEHRYGVYYRLPTTGMVAERVDSELEDIRAHGASMLKAAIGVQWIRRDDQWAASVDALEQFLQQLARHGFSGPLPVDTGLDRLCKILSYDPVAAADDQSKIAQRFRELARQAIEKLTEVQQRHPSFELLATHMDEVFGRGRLERYLRLTELVRAHSKLRVYITIHHSPRPGIPEATSRIDPFVDVRCYNGHSLDDWIAAGHTFVELKDELDSSGDEAWTYYNIRGSFYRPEWTRLVNGFYLWTTPLRVHVPWMYYACFGNPLDDTDGPETRGHDFAYAAPDPRQPTRMVPTRHWVGFREGIDDMRYLETLEQGIAQVPGPQSAAASQWLDGLRARLAFTSDQIAAIDRESPILVRWSDQFNGADYRAIRRQAAQHILVLQRAVGR